MPRIKVHVNENCIGCGACISIAPNIFEFNEDGLSQPKTELIRDKKMIELVEEAEKICPSRAIKIEYI